MADYFDNPLDSAAPEERKRRLLTMYEMTGNPFLQGSPFSAPLRRAGASASFDAPPERPQQPSYAPLVDVPPGAEQEATSAALRGTPAPRAAPRAAAAAADTSLTSIPTQGPQQSRSAAPGYSEQPAAAAAPAAPGEDPRRAKVYAAMRDLEKQMETPDMSQAVNAYRQRYEAAGPDIALGMMLGDRGGKGGRELGGQVLKNALAHRQPQTTDYGTLDATGFTADPMKEREYGIARTERKIALLETIARDAENAEDKRRAQDMANQLRRDQMQMHRETLAATQAQGRFAHYKDEDTGQVVLYNTKTGERVGGGSPGPADAGAPGAPAPIGLKLNESQGKAFDAADKMIHALPVLSSFSQAPSMSAIAALTTSNPAARGALNKTLSLPEQQFVRAASHVLAGVLRKESGAAITAQEWATYGPTYIPWYGDDPQTVKEKLAAISHTRDSYIQQSGQQGARVLSQRYLPKQPTNADLKPSGLPQATRPQGAVGQRTRSYLEQAGEPS